MKELLAEDFFLLHVPIMIGGALLFSSFFLVVTHLSLLNVVFFCLTVALTSIGFDYFGPQMSSSYSGYVPHFWILGGLTIFALQFRLFGKYWE